MYTVPLYRYRGCVVGRLVGDASEDAALPVLFLLCCGEGSCCFLMGFVV